MITPLRTAEQERRSLARLLLPVFFACAIALVIAVIGGSLAVGSASARFIGLMIVWLISGCAVGAFLGLLFGVPRRPKDDGAAVVVNGANETNAQPVRATRLAAGYGGNTNFDDISDWLTKVIVGATLVGLRGALATVWSVARSMNALGSTYVAAGASLVVGASGTGLVAGFISMYLWTRSELPQLFNEAEKLQSDGAPDSSPRVDGDLAPLTHGSGGGRKEASGTTEVFRPIGVAPWAGKLKDLSPSEVWNMDFNRGAFGGSNSVGSRLLTATVGQVGPSSVEVTLEVTSTSARLNPLYGEVSFYLHPTFTVPIIKVQAVNSKAQTFIVTADAFTVGVECDGGKTLLEIDLATVPGFPLNLGGTVPATKPSASEVPDEHAAGSPDQSGPETMG